MCSISAGQRGRTGSPLLRSMSSPPQPGHTCSILWRAAAGCPGSSRRRTAPLEGYSSAQYSGTAGEAEEMRHTEFHFSRGTPGGVPGRAPWNRPDQQGKRKTGPRQWTGPESRRRGSCGPHVPHPAGPGQDGRSQDGGGGHLGGGGRPAAEGGPAGGLPHPHGDPSPGGPGKYLLAGGGRVCLCRQERTGIRHGDGYITATGREDSAPCSTITGRACISWRDRR